MEDGLLDDATLKLLQDYAASAAERIGLGASVSASNGRALAFTITKGAATALPLFCHSHAYSSHEDAVRFIDRMLEEAGQRLLTTLSCAAAPGRALEFPLQSVWIMERGVG